MAVYIIVVVVFVVLAAAFYLTRPVKNLEQDQAQAAKDVAALKTDVKADAQAAAKTVTGAFKATGVAKTK